jgi:capsular polysaccharide biosynthesis protein
VKNREEYELILPEKAMKQQFIRESLSLVSDLRIKLVPDNSLLVLETLTIPSTIQAAGVFSKESLTRVKDFYTKLIVPSEPNKRIFISRQNARARKIVNFPAVKALLEEYSFGIYDFEEVSFLQQVQLLSEASVCISIHGAALANMMFMNSKGKVIELIRDVDGPETLCYRDLAALLDLDYTRLYGKAENPEEKFDTDNLSIDIEQLRKIIEQKIK